MGSDRRSHQWQRSNNKALGSSATSTGDASPEADNGYMEAVTIVEVSDWLRLSLAESALGDADIPYMIEADDPQYLS
jgi:hypothetical protein